ncbi:MAG TPA: type II toxin-antitoxin system PemK/MazF family toxin [Clostridia bacterium]|nr:type II toxin-antitoxin system PemK/MazF family toxin [Clostridia bacterium]
MDALDFNKIDKIDEKNKILTSLSGLDRIKLLQSQINLIYKYWNDSMIKVNDKITASNSDLFNKLLFYDFVLSQAIWANKKIDYPKESPDQIFQWGILNCDLGYNIGSEQNKKRPVIVLNNTFFTRSSMMIVAPITGSGKKIYNPEVQLYETSYSKVTGKIDLSQMRSVSSDRFDLKITDKLMSEDEYKSKYKDGKYTPIQDIIRNKLKNIFGIVI